MPSLMKYKHKQSRSLNLMTSLNKLRIHDPSTCDFEIRLGTHKFKAHRCVLMATSEYFRVMLKSQTEEAKNGYVEITGVDAEAVKACLTYVYSGEIELDSSIAESILCACNFMHLVELREICLDYMFSNASVENSLTLFHYCKQYENSAAPERVKALISRNYDEVIKLEKYRMLGHEDVASLFMMCLDKPTHISWKAITSWVRHDVPSRKNITSMLLGAMKKLDGRMVVDVIIPDCLSMSDEKSLDFAFNHIVSNAEAFSRAINLSNCFRLNSYVKFYNTHVGYSNFKNSLLAFMRENFNEVAQTVDFIYLDKTDVYAILQTAKSTIIDEKVRWNAIVKWITNTEDRRDCFPSLFKTLDLNRFDVDFIKNEIKCNELVQLFSTTKDEIIDFLCSRAPLTNSTPYQPPNNPLERRNIAVFCNQTRELKIFVRDNTKLPLYTIKDELLYNGKLISVEGTCYVVTNYYVATLGCDGSAVEHLEIPDYEDQCQHIGSIVDFQNNICIFSKEKELILDVSKKRWLQRFHSGKSTMLWSGLTLCSSQNRIFSLAHGQGNKQNLSYDPHRNECVDIAPFRYCRLADSDYSSAAVGDSVLIVGGRMRYRTHGIITFDAPMEVYNTLANSWSDITIVKSRNKILSCFTDSAVLYIVTNYMDTYSVRTYERGNWIEHDSVKIRVEGKAQIMYIGS